MQMGLATEQVEYTTNKRFPKQKGRVRCHTIATGSAKHGQSSEYTSTVTQPTDRPTDRRKYVHGGRSTNDVCAGRYHACTWSRQVIAAMGK